jgi:hypothetical protein
VLSIRVVEGVADRARTGTAEGHDLGCSPFTPRPPRPDGDDRTRTGSLSPDKRLLSALELRPQVAPVGFEPTSRAHEAREATAPPQRNEGRSRRQSRHDLQRHRKRRLIWPAGFEPAISGARSRWGGLLPYDQKMSTPGGIRTRSLRVEGPASCPLRPRGRAELRRQESNLRLAGNNRASYRVDDAGMKAEAAGLEPAGGTRSAYALATRCLSNSAMPPPGGRRGSRTPKARRPTRFRDGVPRRWQSFR